MRRRGKRNDLFRARWYRRRELSMRTWDSVATSLGGLDPVSFPGWVNDVRMMQSDVFHTRPTPHHGVDYVQRRMRVSLEDAPWGDSLAVVCPVCVYHRAPWGVLALDMTVPYSVM